MENTFILDSNIDDNEIESCNSDTECCICFESIKKTNNCTTPCGHIFCFNCIVKSLNNNKNCPYCRTILDDSPDEDEDEEIEDEDEDEDDYDEDYEDYDENNDDKNEELLNTLTERYEKNGFTLKDALSMLSNLYSNKNSTYTEEYFDRLTDHYNIMYEDIYAEFEENKAFGLEDHRIEENISKNHQKQNETINIVNETTTIENSIQTSNN